MYGNRTNLLELFWGLNKHLQQILTHSEYSINVSVIKPGHTAGKIGRIKSSHLQRSIGHETEPEF